MKRSLKYITTFILLSGMILSCAMKEDLLLPDSGNDSGQTLFVASVKNFSSHNVATKADDIAEKETNITELAVFLFGNVDGDDDLDLLTETPLYTTGKKLNYVISSSKIDATITSATLYNIQEQSTKLEIKTKTSDEESIDLSACRMYIVANMNETIEDNESSLKSESALLNLQYTFSPTSNEDAKYVDIDIPETGFPMMGSKDINLYVHSDEAIPVPLTKLFTKVNFKIRVNLEAGGPSGVHKPHEPYFRLHNWKVYNLPKGITLKTDVDGEENGVYGTGDLKDFDFNLESSQSSNIIYDDETEQDYIYFSFYMPEHYVTPANKETYWTNIGDVDENLRQCHKPMLCGNNQKPTYVELSGEYSDHQGHLSQVKYKCYLGQDEVEDFNVIRNQELNNIVTITGITNHDQGQNEVSIDHRVHIEGRGYSIALERETLLDSHYEIRPMKITVTEGDKVVVTIPHEYQNWFCAEYVEGSTSGNNLYDPAKQGLRRYFTNDLIDELWGKSGNTATVTTDKTFEFEAERDGEEDVDGVETFTLWFYFDENVDMLYDDSNQSGSDPLFREGNIKVNYYDSDNPENNQERDYIFRQMSLWAINSTNEGILERQYGIEYFEEYLYNYAADDNYGVTKEGMEWGLNDLTISSKYQAIYADEEKMGGLFSWIGINISEIYTRIFSSFDVYYDFYLTRDIEDLKLTKAQARDYSGLKFTKEIVETASIYDKVLTLSGDDTNDADGEKCEGPESAIEYCYNKNKRNEEGEVEKIHWYLPAIDETEEILKDGFSYFPVFQAKYYWSSQPSFDRYQYIATDALGGLTAYTYGYYYRDATTRARATRVTADETNIEPSGVDGTKGERAITISIIAGIKAGDEKPTESEYTYHTGNIERIGANSHHRVRCAYNKDGVSTYYASVSKILATYSVSTDSSTEPFSVTISYENETDTPGVHNVKLSNYLHHNYHSTNYPQAATYDENTGILTIEMGQKIGEYGWGWAINSKLKSGDGPLQLQYHRMTQSFTVIGNVAISDTRNDTECNIKSFTRTNQE